MGTCTADVGAGVYRSTRFRHALSLTPSAVLPRTPRPDGRAACLIALYLRLAPGAPGAVDGRHDALAVLMNDGVEEPVTGEMMVMHGFVGTQHPPWACTTCPAPQLPVMMTMGGRTPPGILELHFAE